MVGETIYAKLVIPNKEVRYIFSQKVQNWFRDSLKEFSIRSNREGGKGRSDLLLKPVRRSREAFAIEFKVTNT
ncbi:MAG: PD-(D/E)XK nuclease domain-containing protein [Lachnospiraceae bacterium]|nr:PD-(D/E)XK nuclease domain-containing protein [Lachnospiraceae bacterium]